ncbi:hypothetical protein ACSX1A_17945 [Pontibacter sp. MBLB2868]|uniref:hypothetical protein n=1 Tax=Pontibacter sp. MBLB2868 TaxID=3451555 RepID=UPI003F7501A9
MKKTVIFFVAAILVAFNSLAQQGNYESAMAKNIQALGNAKTVKEYQQTANIFERIASAEQGQWLPLYYATLSFINMCKPERESDKKDLYLDKAQEQLNKALHLQPKESELHALQGLLHMTRIQISPMVRGMKYSGLATEALEKAKNLNPDNPRAYYLMGTNLYYTPSMFGGGPEAAKPQFEQAKAKFDLQKQAPTLTPAWGKSQNESMLARCN